MSLTELIHRQSLTVVGINSGTSADGLDLVALRISHTQGKTSYRILDSISAPFTPQLRRSIHFLADADKVDLDAVIRFDNLIGRVIGQAGSRFIAKLKRRRITVDLIATHGQTVRHLPAKLKILGHPLNGTLQLGSLDQIAALTGCMTVGNFRQGDIALGGEGAPITVGAMARLFADPEESRLIVNIGGMANYFYFPTGHAKLAVRAADCGPGNVLSDLLTQFLFNLPYDKNGAFAGRGVISTRLMTMLAANPFFRSNRRSTGREDFGVRTMQQIYSAGRKLKLSKFDMLATAAELTVGTIVERVAPFFADDDRLHTVYLMGGGARNEYFVRRLTDMLYPNDVASIAELGFDPQLVESSAYAVMGEAGLRGEPLRTRFDSSRPQLPQPVLGHIVQPPKRTKS